MLAVSENLPYLRRRRMAAPCGSQQIKPGVMIAKRPVSWCFGWYLPSQRPRAESLNKLFKAMTKRNFMFIHTTDRNRPLKCLAILFRLRGPLQQHLPYMPFSDVLLGYLNRSKVPFQRVSYASAVPNFPNHTQHR